jgi:hypothetical protein
MQYLYRYQPFNDKSIRVFTHGELFFYSPSKLNDPFDSKIEFDCDNLSKEDVRQFIEKTAKHGNLRQDINELLKNILGSEDNWKHNLKKQALGILQPEINELGLLSFSAINDDILMWSHYADGHKGFCLQFDKTGLESWKYSQSVDYDDKYLTFREFNNAFPEDNEKMVHILLLRKSKHWKYEYEWRIIAKPDDDNSGNRYYKFPEELLTGVIFGCQMPNDKKKIIKDFLKSRKSHIQFYEAKKKENEFALEIKEIG